MWVLRVLVAAAACAGARADWLHPSLARGPAAANPDEKGAEFWTQRAQAAVQARAGRSAGAGRARNVILFMGDGMSVPTLAAARTLLGQRNGHTGEEAELSFEKFPTSGFSKTYCVDAQVADSACSATALMAGVKNNMGVLGLTAAVARGDCSASRDAAARLDTIAAWALADGRDVGIVTTTRITHASPAAVFAKTADRDWESSTPSSASGSDDDALAEPDAEPDCPDIAYQLVRNSPGNQFKVILGGGRREFLPNREGEDMNVARRLDGRNLIEEWQADKRNRSVSFEYIKNREELTRVAQEPPEYLLGLFEPSHLKYHLKSGPEDPSLAELTELAIRSLSRNEKGFFLFVESGRIDHAHHDNLVHLALDETIELSKAVEKAQEMVSEEDTLVVVTADHAHVMAFNGYPARGRDVLGTEGWGDRDQVPFMTLSYTNGPGARKQGVNGVRTPLELEPNFRELDWRSHADVPLGSETHGGDDVGVFAWGPHHDVFSGVYEQSYIPHLMAYAGCFGPGLHACQEDGNGAIAIKNSFSLILLIVVASILRTCNII